MVKIPPTIKDALTHYFEHNPPLGPGDGSAAVTLEMLQRKQNRKDWQVYGRSMSKAEVMEVLIDLVASGFPIPKILEEAPGFPTMVTILEWLKDYKAFRDMMEVADHACAMVLAHRAEQILESSNDPKQVFRDKAKSDLKMRLAEAIFPKRFGKKQQIDVTHTLDELSSPEIWSRFRSVLISHASMIEQETGIKMIIPDAIDAEIVHTEELAPVAPLNPRTLGMQGDADPESNWDEDLEL